MTSLTYLKLPPDRDLRNCCETYVAEGYISIINDWPRYWENKWLTAQAWMKTRCIKRLVVSPWNRMRRVGWDSEPDLASRYWHIEERGL
jgi:hypothetical protein